MGVVIVRKSLQLANGKGWMPPHELPKTLRNEFDLEANILGVCRATPLFTQIWKFQIPYQKDFGWLVGALKNRSNTLSPYNLVSNQSNKQYLIYLEERDIAWENCRKIQISYPKDFCWLVGALKNRFNTLSLYNLVSNQSDKKYLIYLEKRDIARHSAGKLNTFCLKNPNFLSEGLLLTCGCS